MERKRAEIDEKIAQFERNRSVKIHNLVEDFDKKKMSLRSQMKETKGMLAKAAEAYRIKEQQIKAHQETLRRAEKRQRTEFLEKISLLGSIPPPPSPFPLIVSAREHAAAGFGESEN